MIVYSVAADAKAHPKKKKLVQLLRDLEKVDCF